MVILKYRYHILIFTVLTTFIDGDEEINILCPTAYLWSHNGVCYLPLDRKMDYDQAAFICRREYGGRLLSEFGDWNNTNQMKEFYKTIDSKCTMKEVDETCAVWLYIKKKGGSKKPEDWDQFEDGRSIPKDIWAPREPNNFMRSEECLVYATSKGMMYDRRCYRKYYPLCQKQTEKCKVSITTLTNYLFYLFLFPLLIKPLLIRSTISAMYIYHLYNHVYPLRIYTIIMHLHVNCNPIRNLKIYKKLQMDPILFNISKWLDHN